MQYSWGEKDLLRAKHDLIDLIKGETKQANKYYLLKVLDAINEYYASTYLLKSTAKKQEINDILTNLATEREGFGRYYTLVEKFYFALRPFHKQFTKIQKQMDDLLRVTKKEDFLEFNNQKISNTTSVAMVRKFYATYFPALYPQFLQFNNQKNIHLKFSRENGENSEGYCLFIDGIKEAFVSVCASPFIEKYFTLIHECGHVLSNFINPKLVYSNNCQFFCEVESIFPEAIALTKGFDIFKKEDLSYLYFCRLYDFYEISSQLVLHNMILNSWQDHSFKGNYRYLFDLYKDYAINKEMFNHSLDTTIEKDGTYVISFLAVVELLHLYRKNPKQALQIYQEILLRTDKEDELSFIANRMDLGEHTKEIGEEITDTFKKVLRNRGCRL